MLKLLPTVITSLVFAGLSERYSITAKGELSKRNYVKKDAIFFTIIAVVLSLLVGLRTSYNDTGGYRRGYEAIPVNMAKNLYANIDWDLAKSPGFAVTGAICKYLGLSTHSYFLILASITIGVYIWFIRKYTSNTWLSVFLLITTGCYVFTMAAQRQVLAIAFCTIGVDRAIQKKWINFFFWILIGCSFHFHSFVFLCVLLLDFKPWTKKAYWILGAFIVLIIGFQPLLESIEDFSISVGKGYSVTELSGDGVNILRFLVAWVPIILSLVIRKELKRTNTRSDNIILNLTVLYAEIMLLGLFGTAIVFARLANYFLIYSTIALPELINHYPKKIRMMLLVGVFVGYIVYFYFDNAIIHPFDADYKGISVFEYLSELF